MKKQFILSNKFLVLSCIAFWALMFFAVPSEASPKKYKGSAKQERVFRERKADNQSEQYRIQNKGIKVYNPKKARHARL